MSGFLLRRALQCLATLAAVVLTAFFLMRSVRGGPFDQDRALPPAIEATMRARYHLDWPWWKQLLQYTGPFNLDRDGFAWLGRRDPERRYEHVRASDGRVHVEAEPRPLPDLAGARPGLRAELGALEEAEEAARDAALERLRARAGGSPLSIARDPLWPPILSRMAELARTTPPASARLAALSSVLTSLSGHAPDPDPAPLGIAPESALVRHWYGWYYEQGGDRLENSGARPFGGLLALDLGPSYRYRDFDVETILAQSLPISAAVGSWALVLALVLGLPAGICAAVRPGGWSDRLLRVGASLAIALPSFVLASLLLLVFAFAWPILPVGGWGSPRHLVLPALALCAPYAASIARLTRTALLESLGQAHVAAARARGLHPARIVLVHALPQALLPVLTYLGPAIAGILTGSLVIERIFFLPGTGSHFVNSALNRDYTVAMAVTILYTLLVFLLNTLVDLAYTLIDPRIELERGRHGRARA